jgi:hypothetical protein
VAVKRKSIVEARQHRFAARVDGRYRTAGQTLFKRLQIAKPELDLFDLLADKYCRDFVRGAAYFRTLGH